MTPEVWIAAAACLVSTVVVLINGGRQVGRVEAAITRLVGIEAKLEKIPAVETKITVLENVLQRMRSDHKELSGRVERIRDRLPSVHDE